MVKVRKPLIFFCISGILILFFLNISPANAAFSNNFNKLQIIEESRLFLPNAAQVFDWVGNWSFFINTLDGSTKIAVISIKSNGNNSYDILLGGDFFSFDNLLLPEDFPTPRYLSSASLSGNVMKIQSKLYFENFLASTYNITLISRPDNNVSGEMQEIQIGVPESKTSTGWTFLTYPEAKISPNFPLCGSQTGPLQSNACGEIAVVPTPIPTATEAIITGNVSVTLGCYSKIDSSEENVCTVNVYPDDSLADISFNIAWYVDGQLVFTSNNQSVTIPPLPPGYHEISVLVSSQDTDATARASTITEITEAEIIPPVPRTTKISPNEIAPRPTSAIPSTTSNQTGQVTPVGQAASAVGSLSVLAAWLWLEYRNNSTSYNQNQERLQQQIDQGNLGRRDWFEQRSDENLEQSKQTD